MVTEVGAGEVVKHPPGTPHAWRALEDTECLVFTLGPRSGEDYESDVIRLEEPLL
jgi:quercetin dioxygenase-like cupin family protein